jgi:peptidoglycan hydrolase CwlO-like protein
MIQFLFITILVLLLVVIISILLAYYFRNKACKMEFRSKKQSEVITRLQEDKKRFERDCIALKEQIEKNKDNSKNYVKVIQAYERKDWDEVNKYIKKTMGEHK